MPSSVRRVLMCTPKHNQMPPRAKSRPKWSPARDEEQPDISADSQGERGPALTVTIAEFPGGGIDNDKAAHGDLEVIPGRPGLACEGRTGDSSQSGAFKSEAAKEWAESNVREVGVGFAGAKY